MGFAHIFCWVSEKKILTCGLTFLDGVDPGNKKIGRGRVSIGSFHRGVFA